MPHFPARPATGSSVPGLRAPSLPHDEQQLPRLKRWISLPSVFMTSAISVVLKKSEHESAEPVGWMPELALRKALEERSCAARDMPHLAKATEGHSRAIQEAVGAQASPMATRHLAYPSVPHA